MSNTDHPRPEYLAESLALYESAASEYDRFYFNLMMGGFILLHVDTDDYDLSEIRRGIRRAFDLDVDQQIQKVLLVFREGEPIVYQRESI